MCATSSHLTDSMEALNTKLGVAKGRYDDPMSTVGSGEGPDVVIEKRQWDMTPAHKQWLKKAPNGSVRFLERKAFHSNLLTRFSDVAQHPLPIPEGGTHVAVGFLDLGVLAETLFVHQSEKRGDAQEAQQPPLRWVGVEQSSHCCARALVILNMIQRGVDPAHIVQVRMLHACLRLGTACTYIV